MKIDDRKTYILQAIINDYIIYGEPVGSRTIAKRYDLGISSATIRNEMADLEEMGYLEQLHTSSGRKPSDKGYRLYVDNLMKIWPINEKEQVAIKNSLLNLEFGEIDIMIKEATQILSELTNLTSIVKAPSVKNSSIKNINLINIDSSNILTTIVTDNGVIKHNIIRVIKPIDNLILNKINNILNEKLRDISIDNITLNLLKSIKKDLIGNEEIFDIIISMLYENLLNNESSEVYVEGATNILNYPEYNSIDRAKEFLALLDNSKSINLLLESQNNDLANKNKKVNIKIGKENFIESVKQCAIITASYSYKGKSIGTIGVIGPTRIPYGKVIGILDSIVNELNFNIEKVYNNEFK